MVSDVSTNTVYVLVILVFFFFNDPATTEIYTLSLHDAFPIYFRERRGGLLHVVKGVLARDQVEASIGVGKLVRDRKSTRLNSSHQIISYAVFCLKKKKK